jgi:L-threonylcarbamoyladenylate synthase
VIIEYTKDSLQRIAETIASGGVIGFRTDTFYGLGADPFNPEAVRRIKELKGREENKPILIVISERQQVARFISHTSQAFNNLAKAFWPGPLTLIGEANPDVPAAITAGSRTVGVRLPDDEQVRALVSVCGGALTATSANPSNLAPAGDAQTVLLYFGEKIDLIVDDGEAKTDKPSTVVDLTGVQPKLIREGLVLWSEIEEALAD